MSGNAKVLRGITQKLHMNASDEKNLLAEGSGNHFTSFTRTALQLNNTVLENNNLQT